MIIEENKIIYNELQLIEDSHCPKGQYISGYFLTLSDLEKLVRDFQADCHDGFVSNDNTYIELWLKKHDRIVKKD